MTRIDWSQPYQPDGEDSSVQHLRLMQRRRDRQIQDGLMAMPAQWEYARPILFGDETTREAHERRCREIRRTMTTSWQVAPLHQIRLMDGRVLHAGAAVHAADFKHEDEGRAPGLLISQLVAKGIVLQADSLTPDDEGPQAA